MKTKPRGIHANFESTCFKCQGDITISNGRPEHHVCREWSQTIYATHDEVADGQAFQRDVLARLETAFDNR